jgi:hypothetical protein
MIYAGVPLPSPSWAEQEEEEKEKEEEEEEEEEEGVVVVQLVVPAPEEIHAPVTRKRCTGRTAPPITNILIAHSLPASAPPRRPPSPPDRTVHAGGPPASSPLALATPGPRASTTGIAPPGDGSRCLRREIPFNHRTARALVLPSWAR